MVQLRPRPPLAKPPQRRKPRKHANTGLSPCAEEDSNLHPLRAYLDRRGYVNRGELFGVGGHRAEEVVDGTLDRTCL
jgi:hypothetical protein